MIKLENFERNLGEKIQNILNRVEIDLKVSQLTFDVNGSSLNWEEGGLPKKSVSPFLQRLKFQDELFSGPFFHIEDLLREALANCGAVGAFRFAHQAVPQQCFMDYSELSQCGPYGDGHWSFLDKGSPGTGEFMGAGFTTHLVDREAPSVQRNQVLLRSSVNPLGFLTWLPSEDIPMEATFCSQVQQTALWIVMKHNAGELLAWNHWGAHTIKFLQAHWPQLGVSEWLSLTGTLKTRWQDKEKFLSHWGEIGRQFISNSLATHSDEGPHPFRELSIDIGRFKADEELTQKLMELTYEENKSGLQVARKVSETLFYAQLKLRYEIKVLESIERALEDHTENLI